MEIFPEGEHRFCLIILAGGECVPLIVAGIGSRDFEGRILWEAAFVIVRNEKRNVQKWNVD
jgi:hypothetical protein